MDEQVQVRVHAPAPSRTWAAIVAHATSAEMIACVIAAERKTSNLLRVGEYQRLRDERKFAHLRKLAVPASFVAELAIVVNGDTPASRLDLAARTFLIDKNLIVAARGSRYPAADWRSTLAATVSGRAVVRAHTGAMPRLSITEALPLATIERDMDTEAGGSGVWPGSDLLLRMSQVYRLVDFVRTGNGRAVYRLSDAGVRELARAREGSGGTASMTRKDVLLLDDVHRCKGGDLGELTTARKRAVVRAIEAGWLAEGAKILGTDRRALKVTKGGREAAARLDPAPAKPRAVNVRLSELSTGIWVRMANRRGTGIGPGWVRVVEVRNAMMPGNRELWVVTDGAEAPFVYGDRALYHSTRFEKRSE